MMASRLLKSCAMAPVSWPTTSIFWDCTSWASRALRSVMSVKVTTVPTTAPSLSMG